MTVPRLSDLACTSLTDQAGLPQLVIIGVDAHGVVWVKYGPMKWQKVSRERDESEK